VPIIIQIQEQKDNDKTEVECIKLTGIYLYYIQRGVEE